MLMFCPTCGNLLGVEEGPKCFRFACRTCPYVFNITRKVSSKSFPKLKEVDDVLGGVAAWENVDSTEATCPKCDHSRAYFLQMQTRSADEPMTTFYKCCNHECSNLWLILLGPKNSASILKNAVELLKSGSVIALPTDTLYGIACLSQSSEALRKLYQIKSRDKNKPVAICVSQVSEIAKWGHVTVDECLLHDLLPGPVTLVFERSTALNPELNPGTKLVGIRIPDSWFIRQLANSCAEPLALTSANISGSQSTLSVEEFSGIWEHLGAVYNGGPIADGSTARLGSTVVDLSSPGTYRIIRPGCAETITVGKLKEYGLVEASEFEESENTRDDMNYDVLIKTALTGHLGEAVREVQRQQQQQSTAVVEGNSESAHTLCCVLEALFVHRLRDSFIDKVSSVFSGDVVRQPSPNFWPFLLGFSHRHSVDYLSDTCPWLRSDIGRCRGWIRLVLNDGMLTSYLELLAGERRLLNDFYDRRAYLRDSEHLDIARKLLSGIEMLQFRLAVNSSMLNNWSTTPLLLAGLWSPPTPLVQEAVVQGVDAALCFTDEDETLQHIKQASKLSTHLTATNVPKLDEDMAFRLIIESDRNIPSGMLAQLESPSDVSTESLVAVPSEKVCLSQSLPSSRVDDFFDVEESDSPVVLVTRLRLKNSRSASPAVLEETKVDVVVPSLPTVPTQSLTEELTIKFSTDIEVDEQEQAEEEASTFEDLLENYSNFNIGTNALTKSPNYSSPETPTRDSSLEEKFVEVTSGEKNPESPFISMLLTLNPECSLVKQNYRCSGCSSSIGLIYGPARVCNFSGGLYCSDCHTDADEVIIPARVFLNGDWSKRKVCRAVREFFEDIEDNPTLEAIKFDRNIYSFQREFATLLHLRTQLQHLSAFLLTCRTTDAGEEFRKRTYGKEYWYSEQHSYSLADLPLIQSGQLHQQLTKLFQYGKLHVSGCCLCSMKGFLCEACRSDAVIFPFDLDSTFRCTFCGAVFHSECMDRFKPCPRCERWKSRELNQVEQTEQSDQEI